MEENKSIYINEIIRITYKCNWKCKFCNVIKVNNFGSQDIKNDEIVFKILSLCKKYNSEELKKINLSFSGGEPTLNKNLIKYIKLAKTIGVGIIEIQTNGTNLYKNKQLINDLIDAGLTNIFLAQHSYQEEINKQLGVYYNIEEFIDWVKYIYENGIYKKVYIGFNIVVLKINLFKIYDYLLFLDKINFFSILPSGRNNQRPISFGFIQPNGYAEINKDEVLLRYTNEEVKEIDNIVQLCKNKNIFPDFHFTSPPLCILNYPEYNLEHQRLEKLKNDIEIGEINEGNLESYKYLWKEKIKFDKCKDCGNNEYCLGFYKNWVEFVGEEYVLNKINKFI